jgi:biotin carboxyl carrier protein
VAIPGTIVNVAVGQRANPGSTLPSLEAMKMKIQVTADQNDKLAGRGVRAGKPVVAGDSAGRSGVEGHAV